MIETLNSWLQPINLLFYLIIFCVVMIGYYQHKWGRICKTHVLVLIQKQGGGGDYELAPKEGGSVTLKNPDTGSCKMWPLNELCTIDVPYPGVGFVPEFMQKSIRMIIVPEGDWEPLLNRSPYRELVASPDVKELIQELAEELPDRREELLAYAASLSPNHTREMIASPAVLANLMHERITEAIITVNKEMMDRMASLLNKITKMVSPLMFFIGIGIVAAIGIAGIVVAAMGSSGTGELKDSIDVIQKALGIVTTTIAPVK